MNKEPGDIIFKHILVALDSSQHSMAALEVAAEMARIFEAELEGLFVEDINWFYLSHLPFMSEISEFTGTKRDIGDLSMENEVRAQIKRLRKALQKTGERTQIKYTFRSVRGKVENELITASSAVDLVTIGRLGKSFMRDRALGKTALSLLKQTHKPILLLQHGIKSGQTILVVVNESEVSERALKLAALVAEKRNSPISILLTDHATSHLRFYRSFIHQTLKHHIIPFGIHMLKPDDHDELKEIIHNENGGLVIAYRDNELFNDDNLEKTIHSIDCALLLLS